MLVSLIACVAKNSIIGNKGRLPWHIPDDLIHFRRLTKNKTVIMGRKTFESIGKILTDRHNIVVTSDHSRWIHYEGQELPEGTSLNFVSSLAEAIALAGRTMESETIIIGGSTLYAEALGGDLVNRIYLTELHKEVDGDAFFPEIDWLQWSVVERSKTQQDTASGIKFHIITAQRLAD